MKIDNYEYYSDQSMFYQEEDDSLDFTSTTKGKWILEKHLNNDILRCSICNMDINCMEFGDYYKKHFLFCPFCGKAMSNETYEEFEFSTDDFLKSVLPRHHEPISERDSYNADF